MKRVYEIEEEQIRIQTDLPLLVVQKIEIHHQANAHGTLRIWAEVREEEEEEILYTDWTDTKILVERKEEAKNPFFFGRLERLFCKKENRLLTVEIRGIGETILLDRKKKSQSFQKREMTYKQVVRQVLKDEEEVYEDSFYSDTDSNKKSPEKISKKEEYYWEEKGAIQVKKREELGLEGSEEDTELVLTKEVAKNEIHKNDDKNYVLCFEEKGFHYGCITGHWGKRYYYWLKIETEWEGGK